MLKIPDNQIENVDFSIHSSVYEGYCGGRGFNTSLKIKSDAQMGCRGGEGGDRERGDAIYSGR